MSAPQQGKRRKGGGGRENSRGGGRVKYHLHAVTDEQAARLRDTVNASPLEKVTKETGADVKFDSKPSPVTGMKIVIIRGVPSQIEAVVRLIGEITGTKATLTEEAQTFWLQWVEAAFPDLEFRAYFLPPVYINRLPMTRKLVAGQDVQLLLSESEIDGNLKRPVERFGFLLTGVKTHEERDQEGLYSNHQVKRPPETAEAFISQFGAVQDSDIRYDAAMKQVLFCLQKLSEKTSEILVGITRLHFGQYLSEPCFAVAAAQLPRSSSLPLGLPPNWKQGKFDVLLIHRHYGFVVCNVMSFGDNTDKINMSQEDIDKTIRKRLSDAMSQLNKAEAMLSHLVSDVCPGLRITKTIAVPNLTTNQVQQAISHDSQLTKDLHWCLKTTGPANIAGVCLCADQLSDPKTPWDVNKNVLKKLGKWWTRCVAVYGPDSHMTGEVYKILAARFCGPATTVTIPCTCPPRMSVKTLGQAVWWTGECYTAVITLFPEQLHLLNTQPPRLFVTGPPGTGKTVVLLLMAIEWLRCGHHVYVVSIWRGSIAACSMLYHLLLQVVNTQQSSNITSSQLHLLQYHLVDGKDENKAVNDLSQAARVRPLYVIADEVVTTYRFNKFKNLCAKLVTEVPDLHLWAASCFHGDAPAGWQVEYLTRPLRFPPVIVREVEQDEFISRRLDVRPYSERGVPDHTDGPPVRQLYHRVQGHSGNWPGVCITCGREVASFLNSLRVAVTESGTVPSTTVTSTSGSSTPPCLQWRDVLVLDWYDGSDNSGMVKGLEEAGIPVRVMKDDDIEDVAMARSDVVWVADGRRVRGLERKVVVCLTDSDFIPSRRLLLKRPARSSARLDLMSRCTSQLVIVSPDHESPELE